MKALPITVAMLLSASVSQAQAACGSVTIADMNWSSASLIANVDRFILEHGYGCDAELVPGDTMPSIVSMMEKSEPDVAPEMWFNAVQVQVDRGVSENTLAIAGHSLTDGGEEGFWVPQYMVDQDPSLATIEGIINNVKLFTHPEDPELSAFYGCPAGWGCQLSSENLFRALKLADKGFDLIDPGSGAGLAGSIARAYEREKPWFGYYWAPTAVLGKYPMVKVDFGTGIDKQHFRTCIAKADCSDPKVSMYPVAEVATVTTYEFAGKYPEISGYLGKRSFTNARMNELLAWMEDNQADGSFAAEHFLINYPNIWTAWLPPAVAEQVQSAVDSL